MDAKRSVVPAAALLLVVALGVAWQQGAILPAKSDPLSEQRMAVNAQCAQRVHTPYAQFCVPDGWELEDGGEGGSSARDPDYEDKDGAELHPAGAAEVATLEIAINDDVPAPVAAGLTDVAAPEARQTAIRALVETPVPNTEPEYAIGGTFFPQGTVPLGEVYAGGRNNIWPVRPGGQDPIWIVFRGEKRIDFSVYVWDNPQTGEPTALDVPAVNKAVARILATWAWDPHWADAPSHAELVAEHYANQPED
ncbi:MAG: hypothetical protein J7513_02570 [Solirubrobacteraceae bacterium]|nr:hypothetical protein [Solirubrobacteraceae bacterium]